MKWWLTVFFLMGNQWVSGDQIDGWASRAYDTRAECEQRREFADLETASHPLDVMAVWTCNEGKPAVKPPPPTLEAGHGGPIVQSEGALGKPGPAATAPANLHPGLRLFTHDDQTWIKQDAIGLRFSGPLTPPLAENLRDLFLSGPPTYNHIVLELDSPGGELGYIRKLIEVLAEIRERATLVTRVMGAQVCGSGCVAVFMQGEERKASGASVWIFHGACGKGSNIPATADTEEFLRMLETSGVDSGFLCNLREQGYVSKPGNLFISGYELFHASKAGIITELLPAWQPEDPVLPHLPPPR